MTRIGSYRERVAVMLLLLIALSLTSLLAFTGQCLGLRARRRQPHARYWRRAESYRAHSHRPAARREPVTLQCWIVDEPAPAAILALPAPEQPVAQAAVNWAWFGLADDLPLPTTLAEAAAEPAPVFAWAQAGMADDGFIGAAPAAQAIIAPADIVARLDRLWSAYQQTAVAAADLMAEPLSDWPAAPIAATARPSQATLH